MGRVKNVLLNVILISISLSLDAFGVGVSYKMKGVKITHTARFTIGLVSIAVMWLSLQLGNLMLHIFPTTVANLLGVSVLAIIGISFIRNALFGEMETTYDFNKSKQIDWWEAAILGLVLSADSMSAGIAAVTMGLGSNLIPFSVGFMQVLFLYIADLLIDKSGLVHKLNRKICGIFSGSLLLFIALMRIIG